MASDTPAYGIPRLPTFMERKRAKERELSTSTGEASSGPINRWAVRDEASTCMGPSSSTLRHLSSSVALTQGVGGPPMSAPISSAGPPGRAARKPLPTPMPSRDRVQSHQSPTLPHAYAPQPVHLHSPASIRYVTQHNLDRRKHSSHLDSFPIPSTPPPGNPPNSRPLPQPTPKRTESAPLPIQTQRILPASPLPSVHVSAPDPSMGRSDTVTSIKSLDRFVMTPHGRRPLPRPPGGVGPSRSLDRGIGDVGKEADEGDQAQRRMAKRFSRSTVVEEERGSSSSAGEEEKGSNEGSLLHTAVPSFSFTEDGARSVSTGDADRPLRTQSIPDIVNAPGPGQTPPISLPTISFPDDDDETNSVPLEPAVDVIAPVVKTRTSHAGPGVFCANCDRVILGKVLTAMGGRWHPDCFRCTACEMLLEHVSSYEHGGEAYCHMDYHDKFAPKCYHCGTAIVDSRFVTIDDPDPSLGIRQYHELHFFCGECGDPFLDPSRSSAAGTEASRMASGEGEDETKDFVLHGRHAFCVECDIKLHKPKCRSCRLPIRENAVETMGLKWHRDCFRCAECHGPFANDCFFPRDGKAFCQECFVG